MRTLLQRIPPMVLFLLLTTIPTLLLALSKWHSFPLENGLPIGPADPDPWLRLTLVREWLQGGGWYNHIVTNSNTPFGGIASPWTRPLDLVIAGLVKLQPESIDINLRLFRAALLLPCIWMALLVLGIYRIVRLTPTPPSSFLMASLLVALTPMIWNYFGLANADHHAPLAVLFIWAMGNVLRENPSREAMLISGILFALQLWISVEALILIAVVYLWYGLQWLRGGTQASRHLVYLATGTALATIIAMMIERPTAQWSLPIYDSISIVHALVLTLATLVAWGLHVLPARKPFQKFCTGALLSGAAVIIVYSLYPLFFRGPMAQVDPYILSHFLPLVSEARPFYRVSAAIVIASSILPISVLILCALPWYNPRYRFYATVYATKLYFFIVAGLVLYYSQQRWGYYLLPLSVAAMAPFLGALFTPTHATVRDRWPANKLAHLPESQQVKYRLPLLLLLAATPFTLMYLDSKLDNANIHLLPKSAAEIAYNKQVNNRKSCYRTGWRMIRGGSIDTIAGQTSVNLFAPTDLGAAILFSTHHRIVASNYHREGQGIEYLWEADNITNEKALRRYLAQRRIDALLLCPDTDKAEHSILQGIVAGRKPPAWLEPLNYDLPELPQTEKPATPEVRPILLRVRH